MGFFGIKFVDINKFNPQNDNAFMRIAIDARFYGPFGKGLGRYEYKGFLEGEGDYLNNVLL